MLTIEQEIRLPEGNDFFITQEPNSDLVMYVPRGGRIQKLRTKTHTGTYAPLVWEAVASGVGDSGITEIEGTATEDIVLFLFGKKNDTRILKIPDDAPAYAEDDVYRLYWAYDTEKLYMNIGSVWTMIGTLNHNLLSNRGTMTHEQLEEALKELQRTGATIPRLVSEIADLQTALTQAQTKITELTAHVEDLEGTSSSSGSGGSSGGSAVTVEEGDITISSGYSGKCHYTKIGNLLTITFDIDGDITDLSTLFEHSVEGYFPITLRAGYDASFDNIVPATLVCLMGTCFVRTPPGQNTTDYINAYGSFTVDLSNAAYQST